ncbi:DNA starvation/stationary phase protection protein [Dyadobacter sp. CY261]|uniref:Dps family protein n=1 Tax=Dyadobacter sp. CY261 TaxID=2907203 RepID=UPI001F437F07|nr:DNA starvation/stationary phase protection protein [Dyadobacter sp. CY261]MCF0075286.1 DNA starvation/stationary phase protection protein [Dyadobacter sp. CY261]
MKTNIGILDNHTEKVAYELNKLLANEFVLYTKTRCCHWNISGMYFFELHKLFEGQYEQLDQIMDDIAERIRAIGHYSEARLADILKLTDLTEPGYTNAAKTQLENLLDDHEMIIRSLRTLVIDFAETYKDLGSSDYVTGLLRDHEKMAWMLRAFLK